MSVPAKARQSLAISQKSAQRIVDFLEANNSALAKEVLDELRQNASITISTVWHSESEVMSHWLLLIDGVNHKEEEELAKTLLFWREFYAGPLSRARCVQSSERDAFAYCSKLFSVTSPPVLLVSDHPQFGRWLKFDGQLLSHLMAGEGGLQKFLTRVHTEILHGRSLTDINNDLLTEKFWRGVKIVYKEVKGLISIQLNADPGKI
jgi:hypothetical protein